MMLGQGYTSMGTSKTTVPNPALLVPNAREGEPKYLPVRFPPPFRSLSRWFGDFAFAWLLTQRPAKSILAGTWEV